jgi:methionyl-tRNA synthetase
MENFYVTTPIYYVNDVPHIGHAYSTIAADILTRFYRSSFGKENVLFLTGTDEHGQKVARAADSRGLSPQEHVDDMTQPFKKLWECLNISYSDFIRTTEPRHEKVVQNIFEKLREKGDIYKGTYDGWYCIYEETFYPESQLKDGKCCPECGRETEWVQEESYFFKSSKYQEDLIKKIENNEFKILPKSRMNEVISFLKSGVQDVSVSRTGFTWGVPVPGDESHVVYVWFDALINYLTGCGYLQNDSQFKKFWPADVHIIGKDIIKFHAVIWPAMLMALELDLPKLIFAHGFLTLGEEKISKSKGIVVDPFGLIDKYGTDAYRYFFMSEFTFGLDGEYTEETLIKRINSDLANDLGNLVHRSANMMKKYFEGIVPKANTEEIQTLADGLATLNEVKKQIAVLNFRDALYVIWARIRFLNKYIEDSAPWTLKKESREEELATVMYTLAEGIRIISQLIYPFMPDTAQKIWEQLEMKGEVSEAPIEDATKWGILPPGSNFKVAEPLFPRIEQ